MKANQNSLINWAHLIGAILLVLGCLYGKKAHADFLGGWMTLEYDLDHQRVEEEVYGHRDDPKSDHENNDRDNDRGQDHDCNRDR